MAADFYTTEKRTLGVVLSNTTPPLRVPDYQRDFSWEEQQISEFWTDLYCQRIENNRFAVGLELLAPPGEWTKPH